MNNVILTDCDGVLLNWRDSFDSWMMRQHGIFATGDVCLLYTSPSPRDVEESRMPSSA